MINRLSRKSQAVSHRANARMLRGLPWRVLWLCGLLLPLMAGCKSLPWKSGAVPKSVIACRELTRQGDLAMQQGQLQQAESLFAQAVEACPVDPDARRHYADVLAQRGDVSSALMQLEAAREGAVGDTALTIRTGQLYFASGRLDQAAQLASQALRQDPKSPDAWALRGRIMLARGDTTRALADTQRALGYRPNDCSLLRQTAELYRQLGKPERALICLQTWADTYSTGEECPDLLYLQGRTLVELNRHGDAAECFASACHRGQPTAELYYRLAEAQLASGQEASAYSTARRALGLEPQHVESRRLLARISGTGTRLQ